MARVATRSATAVDVLSASWPRIAAAAWTSFAAASGVLYLVSYWSFFGVNVFEFVSVGDLMVVSIVPLVAGMVGFAFCLTLGGLSLAISDAFFENGHEKHVSRQPTALSRRAVMVRLWMTGVATLIGIGALLVSNGSWYDLAYELAVVMALSCAYLLTRTGVLADIVKNPVLRFCIAAIGFGIPFLSYAHGAAQAYSVKFGTRSYMYACEADLLKETKPDAAFGTELRFIGKAGDFYFFERPFSRQLRLLKFEDFEVFRLRQRFVSSGIERPEKPCASEN